MLGFRAGKDGSVLGISMAPAYRWEGENDAIILSRNELLLADFPQLLPVGRLLPPFGYTVLGGGNFLAKCHARRHHVPRISSSSNPRSIRSHLQVFFTSICMRRLEEMIRSFGLALLV